VSARPAKAFPSIRVQQLVESCSRAQSGAQQIAAVDEETRSGVRVGAEGPDAYQFREMPLIASGGSMFPMVRVSCFNRWFTVR